MELWFTERHTPNVKFSIKVDHQLYSGNSEFQRIDVFDSKEFGRFLSLDGYMTLDTSSMRIGRAEAKLTVPEAFSQNMNIVKNFLPVVEEGGTWYLRRK